MSQPAKRYQPDFRIDQPALAHPPVCPSDKVPFLTALVFVGQSLFGEEWADAARFAARVKAPPGDMSDIEAVWADIQKPAHEVGAPVPDPTQDRAKLEAFHEKRIKYFEANQRAVAHVSQAVAKLRQAVIDRKVVAYWRKDKAGAPFCTLPVEQLLNEHAHLLRWGYIWDHRDRSAQHVFLDAADLLREFPRAPAVEAPAGIDPSGLSKYLQLALHVHSQGFGPDFRGEKKEIQRALVAAAPRFGLALSGQQEAYLATFLRNFDAQAGRNRRKIPAS